MNENIRLEAVARFINLKLEEDSELQEIVELASTVCQAPFAFITLLDHDTIHLKVRKGFDCEAVPRTEGFATETIKKNDLFIVPDALKHKRYKGSLLVSAEPAIRFYAGMPITTAEGCNIGTVCVLDVEPHEINEQQKVLLKLLAKQAMKALELRLKVETLEKNKREVDEQREFINDATIRLRSFFESSTNFQVLLGRSGEVIDFNKTAFKFVEHVHKTKMQRGDMFVTYVVPSFVSTFLDKYNHALLGEKSIEEGSTNYGEAGTIYWDASFEPAHDKDNQIIGVSYVIRNVTERKIKEQQIISQNDSLLHIAHIQAHEFRAPLTTIMGLMNLIKEEDYNAPKEYLQFLEQAISNLDNKIKYIVDNIEDTMETVPVRA